MTALPPIGTDRDTCPGTGRPFDGCWYCTGEACARCGSGLAADVALGYRPPCEHDVIDRHGETPDA